MRITITLKNILILSVFLLPVICYGDLHSPPPGAVSFAEFEPTPEPYETRNYPNLVFNDSFEEPAKVFRLIEMPVADRLWVMVWDPNQTPHWSFENTATRDETHFHTGKACLKISGQSEKYCAANQNLTLLPETEYRLSGWFKTTKNNGKGAAIRYRLKHKEISWQTPFISKSSKWQKSEIIFRTPSEIKDGVLEVILESQQESPIWIDDICLEPTSGKVPVCQMPVIDPSQGEFYGPIMVRMSCATSQATIRFTEDGQKPMSFSEKRRYTMPFLHSTSPVLKARAFHTAMKPSPITEAHIVLKPVLDSGVPFYSINWEMDVEQWWKGHPYNPSSPIYIPVGEIVIPFDKIVNVRTEFDGNIQKAIDAIGKEGGALFFPAGEYDNRFCIHDLSNIYFLGEAGTIFKNGPARIHAGPDTKAPNNIYWFPENYGANRPNRCFYFKDIIFDGGGTTNSAFSCTLSQSILFDRCRFQGYVGDNGMSFPHMDDYLAFRQCSFDSTPPGYNVYLDGVHGAVFFDCVFESGGSGIIGRGNQDVTRLSSSTRSNIYWIVANNNFKGGHTALGVSAHRCLFIDNKVRNYRQFFKHHGGNNVLSAFWTWNYSGVKLVGNKLESVTKLIHISGYAHGGPYYISDFEIRNNETVCMDYIADLDPVTLGMIKDIFIHNNQFAGDLQDVVPQLWIRTAGVENIRVYDNKFIGVPRSLLKDDTNGRLGSGAITFINNSIN